MSIIALLGSLAYYIQAYKTFKIKKANDLAKISYLLSCFTSVNWLLYGIFNKDVPLVISGVISTIGSGLVIIGIILYTPASANTANNN